MAPKKAEAAADAPAKEAPPKLGPQNVLPGEDVFGVAHIYASFNDTFIHVTDRGARRTYRD